MRTEKLKVLIDIGERLVGTSAELEGPACESDDARLLRAHLDLEELGEFLIAMGTGDEVGALDGITDRLYVLLGTAVVFDWPLEAAFASVHLSNLTKTKKADDESSPRVRNKGEEFVPPDLGTVLLKHRNADITQGRNLVSEMEKRWLEQHPPVWNALTLQGRELLNVAAQRLLEGPDTEAFVEGLLIEIRDGKPGEE
jgi:hypothetical protein